MNTIHKCAGSSELSSGRPCNANPQFQQHGFSTLIRDPKKTRDPLRRFNDTFLRTGVLTSLPGVAERVMLISGLGEVVSRSRRLNGEYTGEFSLTSLGFRTFSMLARYHPSVNRGEDYVPVSQWQALLAWGGFWAAFSRERDGIEYITESDLRSFFLEGDFPADWQTKPWGFRTNFEAVVQLKGVGCGDEMIQVVEDLLQQAGPDPTEEALAQLFIGTVRGFGTFTDDIYNRFDGR